MLYYKIIFWGSLIFIFYAYFGYFFILKVISLFVHRKVKKEFITPNISIIITAHNEEERIREKIENTLAITYPEEKREIIVASDCSTDGTDDIVRSFAPNGVKLVRTEERKGKEFAQGQAVKEAKGEILVFTDVATIIKKNTITEMINNFADPSVGCVSSEDKTLNEDGNIEGEGLYVKYEMKLRQLESKVHSLVGLSGSFFAARKSVCQDWRADLQSDFNTLFNAIKMGLRGISEPLAVGIYKNVRNPKKEFERKVRTVVRGLNVFFTNYKLQSTNNYFFSFQLLSHKLCRWLVPFALFFLFMSNILFIEDKAYAFILLVQVVFYVCAVLGSWFNKWYFRVPCFFINVNYAILIAWYKYIKGERFILWKPSER